MSSIEPSESAVDISVVIGFKDWGVDRLVLAVKSLVGSFGSLRGEVIVSDYGSKGCPNLREKVEALGARYVYTHTDGVWSRSRALNAGFAVSTGRVLVSTDADMLFSPRSMEVIGSRLLANPNESLVLQCRDLPEGMGSEYIALHGIDWSHFAAVSTLRPRWGMGGMMAVPRRAFMDVRGFDERMQVYGGEDLDFAQRIRRSGRRVTWLDHPDVRMYHMWHPSSRAEADKTAVGRAAIEYNRGIYLEDESIIRNTARWIHQPPDAPPVATVVIVTHNRADMLRESVHSALAQTVRDIEVIVVDDGSTDHTEKVIASIDDPRLRYFKRPQRGIAASRNFAAQHSRARYTVIQDDDDLMMPRRIEHHLAALRAGDAGTYGGWIDFDGATGDVVSVNPGLECSLVALLFASKVFAHPTLMLDTSLIRDLGYDERFTSGSDYNLAIRLVRLGVRLRHTGQIHLVRRLHGAQVTTVDSARQKFAARWTAAAALSVIPPERHAELQRWARRLSPYEVLPPGSSGETVINPYLPDTLVRRTLHVTLQGDGIRLAAELGLEHLTDITDRLHEPASNAVSGVLKDATWHDMARLTMLGATIRVLGSELKHGREPSSEGLSSAPTPLDHVDALVRDVLRAVPAGSYVLMTVEEGRPTGSTREHLGHWTISSEHVILLPAPDQPDNLEEWRKRSGELRVLTVDAHSVPEPPNRPGEIQTSPSPAATSSPRSKSGSAPRPSVRNAQRPVNRPRSKPRPDAAPSGDAAARAQRAQRVRKAPAGPRVAPEVHRRPAGLLGRRRVWAALAAGALGVLTLTLLVGSIALWSAPSTAVVVGLLVALGFVMTVALGAVAVAVLRSAANRVRTAVTEERRARERALRTTQAELRRIRRQLLQGQQKRHQQLRKAVQRQGQAARLVAEEAREESRVRLQELESGVASVEATLASQSGAEQMLTEVRRVMSRVEEADRHITSLLAQQPVDLRRQLAQQMAQYQSLLTLDQIREDARPTPPLGDWAVNPDLLTWLLEEFVAQQPRLVVECGSGASTVWLGLAAKKLGISTRIIALEHDPAYAEATRRHLERLSLDDVCEVRDAELTQLSWESGDQLWYDLTAVKDLDGIGLLFVDGPPGDTGPQARFPAVPALLDRLAPECCVILDDFDRPEERRVMAAWQELLPGWQYEELPVQQGAAVLRRKVP